MSDAKQAAEAGAFAALLLEEREHEVTLGILRDLIQALPACDVCGAPATRAFERGAGRWCDAHGQQTFAGIAMQRPPDYPRALLLRAGVARLIAKGKWP